MQHNSGLRVLPLLFCHVALAAAASEPLSSGAGSFGVKVQGNTLVSTQDGHAVQLLGVSVSGLEQGNTSFANKTENYGNPTDPGFAAMASWNMNVVRLPLNEQTWLGVHNCARDGGSAAELQSNVQRAVRSANAAGLYVILDLHWAAPDSFGCPKGQGSMPDADHSIAFWKTVAGMFKDNPAVLFELFNEPFGLNDYGHWIAKMDSPAPGGQTAPELAMLLHGGTYAAGYMYQCNDGCNLKAGAEYLAPHTAPFQAAGIQTLVDAIRSTGATNVILANPIGWAGQIQTWMESRPTDPAGQLVAGWHEDGGAHVTVGDAQAVLGSGYPIVITEAYSIGDSTFDWAVNNLVGFLYWSWVDWGGGGLLADARTHAASNNGVALKTSYCRRPKVNKLAQCA